MCKNVVDPDRP